MTSASPFSILQDELQPASRHSHESFSAVHALEGKPRSMKGEVRFDDVSCSLYATDVRVQLGTVLGTLRVEAGRYKLTFAPDQPTPSRRTHRGMIGNNAYGVHALTGGLVSDGFSCREQIKQDTPRHAVHLAEVRAGNCSWRFRSKCRIEQ
ncbi:MAG: hypothetical protein ACYCOR_19990 [Acidobacteriaceae bacterium]